MREIAAQAGIRKGLLLHCFRNKKELYRYLRDNCAGFTLKAMEDFGCYGGEDLFDSMLRGVQAKMSIIRQYPYMTQFTIRAFYEKDEDVCAEAAG